MGKRNRLYWHNVKVSYNSFCCYHEGQLLVVVVFILCIYRWRPNGPTISMYNDYSILVHGHHTLGIEYKAVLLKEFRIKLSS